MELPAGQAGESKPQGGTVFATITTTQTGSEPVENGTIIAEEMERWLRDLDGFLGFLLLAREGQALGITFWANREVAERYTSLRSTFRERVLALAGVQIEEVDDYDVAFARLAPGFAAPPT
jgi:hypothetical protein